MFNEVLSMENNNYDWLVELDMIVDELNEYYEVVENNEFERIE